MHHDTTSPWHANVTHHAPCKPAKAKVCHMMVVAGGLAGLGQVAVDLGVEVAFEVELLVQALQRYAQGAVRWERPRTQGQRCLDEVVEFAKPVLIWTLAPSGFGVAPEHPVKLLVLREGGPSIGKRAGVHAIVSGPRLFWPARSTAHRCAKA